MVLILIMMFAVMEHVEDVSNMNIDHNGVRWVCCVLVGISIIVEFCKELQPANM